MPEYALNNFGFGEISPKWYGRVDLPQYRAALRTAKNVFVMTTGGVSKRPGTFYMASAKNSGGLNDTVRLVPFTISATETEIIEFGHSYCRFYGADGQILSEGSAYEAYEIVSQYAAADLNALKFVQVEMSLYIFHRGYAPKTLTRTSRTSWVFAAYNPASGTSVKGISGITLTSGSNVSITTTAAHGFSTGDYISINSVEGTSELNSNMYVIKSTGTNTFTLDGTDGANFTAYTSGGTASKFTALITNDLTSEDERAGAVAIYDQRLFAAGTEDYPGAVYASYPSDLGAFPVSAGDPASGIEQFPRGSDRLDIQWIATTDYFIVGTTSGIWRAWGAESAVDATAAPIMLLRQQNTIGASHVQALVVSDSVFYVERGGTRIRQANYSQSSEQLVAQAISTPAEHYFESNKITEMHYQQVPDTCLWAVRESGGPAVFSYSAETGTMGWSEIDVGGDVISMAVATEDGEDRVWMAVQREIDGATKTYIELMNIRTVVETEECMYVDAGVEEDYGAAGSVTEISLPSGDQVVVTITSHGFSNGQFIKFNHVGGTTELNGRVYEVIDATTNTFDLKNTDGDNFTTYTSGGTATLVANTVTGLGHLEGAEVAIWADGAVQTSQTVDSGEITLDKYANHIYVGLPYTAIIETLDITEAQAAFKRVHSVLVRFFRTIGAQIGRDEENLNDVNFRSGDFVMGEGPDFFSDVKHVQFSGDYNFNGRMMVVSSQPAPMTVLAIVGEVEVYDGN